MILPCSGEAEKSNSLRHFGIFEGKRDCSFTNCEALSVEVWREVEVVNVRETRKEQIVQWSYEKEQ